MLEKIFENKTIRTVVKDDGVWVVAKDVATALGFRSTNDMTRVLDEDEKGTHIVPTLGG